MNNVRIVAMRSPFGVFMFFEMATEAADISQKARPWLVTSMCRHL